MKVFNMIKTLAKSVREYKKPSILTPVLITGEVIVECIIPFVTGKLIEEIRLGCGVDVIVKYGLLLVALAMISLSFGALAAHFCSVAACGFAKNLRHDLFYAVQG